MAEEAQAKAVDLLLGLLADAVNGGASFTSICHIFPPEVRLEASKAFKTLGRDNSSEILESLTATPNLQRLWN